MYAIISTGGKQYRVSEGDKVRVEHLNGEVGEEVVFDRVLFVGGDDAGTSDGAVVSGTIVDQGKASKVVVFKFKRRKMYRRKRGHRQPFTEVEINQIGSPSAKKSSKKASAKSAPKKAESEKSEKKDSADSDSESKTKPKGKSRGKKAAAAATKKKAASSTKKKAASFAGSKARSDARKKSEEKQAKKEDEE